MNKLLAIIIIILFGASAMQSQIDINDAEIKNLTLKKTQDLGHHIRTIGDKNINRDLRSEAVQTAVGLFINDKSSVEVSSTNPGAALRKYTIRRYLNNLMVLKYNTVDITWYDINIISDFKTDPDGNLRAVVQIYQKFTGYDSEGNVAYEDTTIKNIQVKLTQIEINTDKGIEKHIQVYLGDIKVVETR